METRGFAASIPGGAAAALLCATALAGFWRVRWLVERMHIGEVLAVHAVAFERSGKSGAPAVLVVGDSTGVGTGASRPEDSIAGRLAAAFPNISIDNRAANGARTLHVIRQLSRRGRSHYDLVLVHAGGNDVLRRTPLRVLAPQIDTLIGRARELSNNVIVTTVPNIGLLPIFFPPLSWWISSRSRRLCALYAAAARLHGAHYLDFFHERGECPFASDPARYFARDGLHPSTDCYGYVFDAIMKSKLVATGLALPDPA